MEISNRFCIISPELIRDALLMGQTAAPGASTRIHSACGPIIFDQTPDESDSGTVWNQTFRAVTDDPAVFQHNGSRRYPAFYMSDGSLRVIGTHDCAPLVTVTPANGGRYLVQASFQAPEPLSL